jgi:hypothetical protein
MTTFTGREPSVRKGNALSSTRLFGRYRKYFPSCLYGRPEATPKTPPLTYALEPPSWSYMLPLEDSQPRSIEEGLSAAFIDGVEYGYYRRKITHIERSARCELLEKAVELKRRLWGILGLPEGMQRGHTIVRELMVRKGLRADTKKVDT